MARAKPETSSDSPRSPKTPKAGEVAPRTSSKIDKAVASLLKAIDDEAPDSVERERSKSRIKMEAGRCSVAAAGR